MTKKATIGQFKKAFRKPKRVNAIASKEKGELEKLADDLAGVGPLFGPRRDGFMDKTAKMNQKEPAYFAELLTYKLAKHWKEPEQELWLSFAPDDALQTALANIFGDNPTVEEIEAGVELGTSNRTGGGSKAIAYLFDKAPDRTADALIALLGQLPPDKRTALANSIPTKAYGACLTRCVANQDAELTKLFASGLNAFTPEDLRAIATQNPGFFIKHLLEGFKSNAQCVEVIKDPKMRAILARDKQAWAQFVATTPLLAMIENVQTKLGDQPKKKAVVEGLFDALVKNDGIELTYFTNALEQDRAILTGLNDSDKQRRAMSKIEIKDLELPEKPATQCHNLLAVLKHSIQAVLGDKVTITSEDIAGMLLTKPLSGMPGGLLPNSFGGNVVDDNGKHTGQVLFTGNEQGKQSHTWLVIDGVPFDPVLGTKGDEVANSVANEFSWMAKGVVAKGRGGWYILPDKNEKAALNSSGFGPAYRLTKQPADYGAGVLGVLFTVVDKKPRVDEVIQKGPAVGKLQPGDVVLEVDDTKVADKIPTECNECKPGESRKFKVLRDDAEVTVSVTAVDPTAME